VVGAVENVGPATDVPHVVARVNLTLNDRISLIHHQLVTVVERHRAVVVADGAVRVGRATRVEPTRHGDVTREDGEEADGFRAIHVAATRTSAPAVSRQVGAVTVRATVRGRPDGRRAPGPDRARWGAQGRRGAA